MTNVAGGNATVEAQIGVVQGNAVFHRHETVYQAVPGDTPERRLQVALANLDAGSAHVARRLLHDLLVGEQPSTRVAYYSALAVVHGRGPRDLGSVEFAELDIAHRVAARLPRDDWWDALEVVLDLVGHAVDRAEDRGPEVLDRLESLPRERHAEAVRHLDLVLDGVHGSGAHRARRGLIEERRQENDRRGQSWKFFEPEPAPPLPAHLPREPSRSGPVQLLLFVLAAAGVLYLVEEGGWRLGGHSPLWDDLHLPLILGATAVGTALVGFSWYRCAFVLRQLKQAERLDNATAAGVPGGGTETERRFAARITELVGMRFEKRRRAGDTGTDEGPRWSLTREIVETYRGTDVGPSAINWLIRSRVGEITEHRHVERSAVLEEVRRRFRRYVLVCAAGGAIIVGELVLSYFSPALGAVLDLLAVAAGVCALVGQGVGHLVAVARWRARVKRDRAERLRLDQRHHAELVEALRTRPDDGQIARWLDHDKAAIKMSALHRCDLASHDVLAQVTLVEGARDAARARVLLGPPRYSAYVVRVFFLTARGVRQIEVDLDLLDGSVHNERRASFRYDALASARVSEVGVRFAKGLRQLVVPDQAPVDDDDALVLSQAFSLSLVNGESITVVVENFEGLRDAEVESLDQLRNLALDTAGVVDALRVLEAVASEGREWSARELDQRHWRRPDPVAGSGPVGPGGGVVRERP
ncbi:hypothetical protein Q5530_02075 [Saccharothrix sp. BKS2]|uniref:hypothetical protein n=1 Tax=Saccharothrix sp. BKS2 TaxID=3064400 RepID=UPI0039E909C3